MLIIIAGAGRSGGLGTGLRSAATMTLLEAKPRSTTARAATTHPSTLDDRALVVSSICQ
jgi:hypothetical protein